MEDLIRYCRLCGTKLTIKKSPRGFSPLTGKREFEYLGYCPKATNSFLDQLYQDHGGHDWGGFLGLGEES